MDGSFYQGFNSTQTGRRIRPITLEYAEENVPIIVLLLKRDKLIINSSGAVQLPKFYTLTNKNKRDQFWQLLEVDYELVIRILNESTIPLFDSDVETILTDRLLSLVRLYFKGRGVPK